MDSNKGFSELYSDVIKAGNEADKLNKTLSIIDSINMLSEQIELVKSKLSAISTKYDSIPMNDVLKDYNGFIDLIQEYTRLHTSAAYVAKTRKNIGEVSQSLSSITSRYSILESAVKDNTQILESVESSDSLLSRCKGQLTQCKSLQDRISSMSKRMSYIDSKFVDIPSVEPDIVSLSVMESDYGNIDVIVRLLLELQKKIKSVSGNISDVDFNIQGKSSELEELKSSVGYCPFCGSVFDKSLGHSH